MTKKNDIHAQTMTILNAADADERMRNAVNDVFNRKRGERAEQLEQLLIGTYVKHERQWYQIKRVWSNLKDMLVRVTLQPVFKTEHYYVIERVLFTDTTIPTREKPCQPSRQARASKPASKSSAKTRPKAGRSRTIPRITPDPWPRKKAKR